MRLVTVDGGQIVPTHVGVNRRMNRHNRRVINSPHACGGEPIMMGSSQARME